jgi:tetratricopeptide (TPR) repeat protein
MSLLLQALQKAAKNRESGSVPVEEPAPSQPPPTLEPPAAILPPAFALDAKEGPASREPELALAEEDLFEADEPLPEESAQRFEPFAASAAAAPSNAAAILRASDAPSASWVDWLRDRPVWALGFAAGIFLAFYFIYVYLQIAHPGILRGEFMRQPLASTAPPSGARPVTTPPRPAVQREALSTPAPSGSATAAPGVPPAVAQPVQPVEQPPSTQASVTTPPGTRPSQPIESTATAKIPAGPVKLERTPKPTPSVVVAAPRAPVTQEPERTSNPEQAMHKSPAVPKRRVPKEPTEPVMSTPALENEISSKPAEAGTAVVAPLVKDAYRAMQDGQIDRAETLYRNALQNDAQNVDALLGLAAIAAQRAQVQQSIGFYERALEIEPRNATAQAGLIALMGQADPQMSETRLKQLIAREPSAFLYYSLGNLHANQNQWPAAQQAYYQAFQMQQDNPDYAYNLAVGLEHLNQPKLALTYYRKAIELSFAKGRANFDQNRVIERIGQLSARHD